MLIREIKALINNQQLVSLELADLEATEVTGFFLSATDELVVIQMIGNDGSSEGFTLFEPDLISEIYWGNREHQCIQALARKKSQVTPVLFKSDNFRDAIIELSSRYQNIALYSLDKSDNFEIGRIVDHDDEWLKIQCSGTLKTLSHLSKLTRIDNICRVEFGSPYITDLIDLHKHQSDFQ